MPFVLWCCTAGSLGRPSAVSFFGVARRSPLDVKDIEWEIVSHYFVDEMKARLKCAQSLLARLEVEEEGRRTIATGLGLPWPQPKG